MHVTWKSWQFRYQYSHTRKHFSDATNSVQVADATRGIIPGYSVMDASISYRWGRLLLQSGVNNIMDRLNASDTEFATKTKKMLSVMSPLALHVVFE